MYTILVKWGISVGTLLQCPAVHQFWKFAKVPELFFCLVGLALKGTEVARDRARDAARDLFSSGPPARIGRKHPHRTQIQDLAAINQLKAPHPSSSPPSSTRRNDLASATRRGTIHRPSPIAYRMVASPFFVASASALRDVHKGSPNSPSVTVTDRLQRTCWHRLRLPSSAHWNWNGNDLEPTST